MSNKTVRVHNILYLDIVRMVACLAVVMYHVSAQFSLNNIADSWFLVDLSLYSVSSVCVVLFVMLSGACILDENYSFPINKMLQKIKRLIIFFFAWSIPYCILFRVIQNIVLHDPLDPYTILSALINGHEHLWFIPMIIGLYLFTPLLRLWVKRENKKYIEYFLILSLSVTCLLPQLMNILIMIHPYFSIIKEFIKGFQLSYVTGFLGYYILGWYFHNFGFPHIRSTYIIGFGSLVCIIWGTYFLSMQQGSWNSLFFNYANFTTLAYSAAVFLLIRQRFQSRNYDNSAVCHLISCISRNSMGIYAMHSVFIGLFNLLPWQIPSYIGIPLCFLIASAVPLFASVIMKKIPLFKYMV